MRSIEILTTQNVPIVYELATLRDRVVAFLLDALIIYGSIVVAILFLSISGWFTNPTIVTAFIFLFAIPIFFFYTVCMEIFNNGQSLGKKVLKLKVIKLDGHETAVTDYMLRSLFRTLDIYFSIGAIAAIMVSSSESSQRLGDIVANTTVIRLKPKFGMDLKDLLQIGSPDNYTPQYPGVCSFNDQQMLLVKTVLDRAQKFNNKAHYQALELMALTLSKQLGLEQPPADKQQFIKAIVKDYVILTR